MYMSLGERLRKRREYLGLTNGQVSTYLGISKAHVSDMEHGKSNPSLELLGRLARYYRTTTDFLLEITDNPAQNSGNGDVLEGYTVRDSYRIFEELPDGLRTVVTRLAVSLQELVASQNERVLGQFIMRMLGDIEDRYGEEATTELTSAIELFTRAGDDSALRAWFRRYFGPDNLLPDDE